MNAIIGRATWAVPGTLPSTSSPGTVAAVPLVTTEAWGPVSYADTDLGLGIDEWAWVRNLAEHAVTRAIQFGWQGICTSNFSQPHHRGMWVDAGWHRELTDEIRGTHKPT